MCVCVCVCVCVRARARVCVCVCLCVRVAKLVERLDKASTAYGMEISAEKTNLMTNKTSGINKEIKVNGQKLERVTSFKYLGSFTTDEGSKSEILSMIAHTTAALTRSKPV